MQKAVYKGIFLIFICTLVFPAYAAANVSKVASRAEGDGITLITSSAKNQTLELNSTHIFSVQLLSGDAPVASANVTWSIERKIISESSLRTAYFLSDETSQSTLLVVNTDENGISTVTLNTGDVTAAYTVKALTTINVGEATTDLEQTFEIVVGIQASVIPLTPEAGIATSLDKLCPQLEAANLEGLTDQQKALIERCSEIQQALSEGKTLEVGQVLRKISPEEVAVQSVVGSSFSSQQISNIASRLSAVRRGGSRLSFSNLGFNYKGQSVPLGYLLSNVFSAAENETQVPGLLSNRWGAFVNGNASFGNRSTTAREDGFEFDNFGLTLGADYRIKQASFAGVTLGLAKSDIQIANSGGDMAASGRSIGIYGTHYFNDKLYVDGIINLGNNNYEMNRHINFDLANNPVDRTAESSADGAQRAISAGAGYEVNDGALSINFYGRLNYSQVNIDGFSETGAQELNMKISSQNMDSLISTLGAQLAYTHSTRWGVLMPFLWFAWEHEYSGESDTINAAFVDDQFGASFDIFTEKEDSNYFSSGQGVSAILPHGISVYIRMENMIGKEHYSITNVSVGGRMELAF